LQLFFTIDRVAVKRCHHKTKDCSFVSYEPESSYWKTFNKMSSDSDTSTPQNPSPPTNRELLLQILRAFLDLHLLLENGDDEATAASSENGDTTPKHESRKRSIMEEIRGLIQSIPKDDLYFEEEGLVLEDVDPDHENVKGVQMLFHEPVDVKYFKTLPIHWAVCLGLYDVAQLILEEIPDAASFGGEYLPLFVAAECGQERIARLLLQHYPEGASFEPYPCREIPLHVALQFGQNAVARVLLEHYPESACQTDSNGFLPLHYMAGSGDIEGSKLCLEHYPEGASDVYCSSLPLHEALKISGNEEIVRLLLERHPDGVAEQMRSRFDRDLPLHIVAKGFSETSESNVSYLRLILTAGLQCDLFQPSSFGGLFQQTKFNTDEEEEDDDDDDDEKDSLRPSWENNHNTPWAILKSSIHKSSKKCCWDELAQVFQTLPEDTLILHAAIDSGAVPLDDLRLIIARFGVLDLSKKDGLGRTAFIVAIQKAAKHERHWNKYYKHVLQMTLDRKYDFEKRDDEEKDECNVDNYDDTCYKIREKESPATIRDIYGRLPLKIAIHEKMHVLGLKCIISANVNALLEQDLVTGLYPFMLCASKEADHNLSAVYEMLRTKPDQLMVVCGSTNGNKKRRLE